MIIDKSDNKISTGDLKYLQKAHKYFNIKKKIVLHWSILIAKHPDIWVINNSSNIASIYVTQEWKDQYADERRKRLTHELYHILGNNHWNKSKLYPIKTINFNLIC